jgi:hypothetical protein
LDWLPSALALVEETVELAALRVVAEAVAVAGVAEHLS